MTCPNVDTEYPGLAYLCPLDEIIVTQARDALHDIIGDRARISYTIFNNRGQKIFIAVRIKGCRKFTIKVYNIYGNEVIEVRRPFALCVNRVLVWAPPGNFVGSVKQLCNKYAVTNDSGVKVLNIRIQRPLKLIYNIRYVCGVEPIGVIKQHWDLPQVGGVKNFGVSFPVQLNVQDKAVLLGACFLIGCLKY
ncbi:unnamed protein product [Arctia plantaginis]|uniref:Phospholipid scramblase n=1 Tax=Arctia plantaginis TaxID=874455 RepID=A0A8S1BA36_ARCPL|nr:unnamed protein product [Arctia plantaginis]CAB3258696.1 unnamed protein product [Arctia plantaginis]